MDAVSEQNLCPVYPMFSCLPLGLHALRSSCSFTWPNRVRTLQVIQHHAFRISTRLIWAYTIDGQLPSDFGDSGVF